MTKKQYPSNSANRVTLRFDGAQMKLIIKERAAKNRRAMNSEILHLIEVGLDVEAKKEMLNE